MRIAQAKVDFDTSGGSSTWLAEQKRIVLAVLKKPSFLIMVTQGQRESERTPFSRLNSATCLKHAASQVLHWTRAAMYQFPSGQWLQLQIDPRTPCVPHSPQASRVLSGYTDLQAATITSYGGAGSIFGTLLGGWLGDRLGRMWPDGGRIVVAQLSVLLGIVSFAVMMHISTTPGQPALLTA
eukprot:3451353-Amphidinium_carterae.1